MNISRACAVLLSLTVTSVTLFAHADGVTTTVTTTEAGPTVSVLVPTEPPSHVHLEGKTPGLTLDRRAGVTMRSGVVTDELWQTICAAPCDATLPADGRYRVSAPDTVPEYVPRLRGQDAELEADLHGDSSTRIGLAVIFAGVGAMALGTGLLVSEASHAHDTMRPGQATDSVSYAPGIVTLSLSLPLMIVGAAIAASGQGSLTVSTHDATPMLSLGDGLALSPSGLVF